MAAGKHRGAVQELLWLLETVTTAFRDLGEGSETVPGKYFNEIAKSLKQQRKGSVTEQALNWLSAMHGYLSSPTGGGIRHGQDLKSGVALTENDATLIANLIRSYVNYLIAEHHAMANAAKRTNR